MALEKELAVFDRELPRLLRTHRGQFVLIHGEAIDGGWTTEDEAYTAGCERFGLDRVQRADRVFDSLRAAVW